MVGFGAVLKTSGDGYWSGVATAVKCTKASVPYVNDDQDFGELRVYFDIETWDVNRDGLIYTDSEFIKGVKSVFADAGFDASDITYSEQGMQGNNYVSMDVGAKFLKSWDDIVGCV